MPSLKTLGTQVATRLFGTKFERDMKQIRPLVEEINERFEALASLTDDELRAKTDEFRRRLKDEEATLDDLLPEAFAVVKEACRRHVGQSWSVVGQEIMWDMVPYDVQLIGGIVLHQGKIAEMATGEGKTLVAVFPLYLNALTARGVHLITVNDYLARRDSEWMGRILRFLGITVGCIQNDMAPDERREQYSSDITYGTNNEFGFDYLRDNMAVAIQHRVQRGHSYAIVDEVDSVLIDEARTPLIISGPVEHSNQEFEAMRPIVENLVRAQTNLITSLLNEIEKFVSEDGKQQEDELAAKLLMVQRGAPKNKRFMKLLANEPSLQGLIHRLEMAHIRDKTMGEVDEELYFSIDEKQHSIDLSDKGRESLSPRDRDTFLLPDLAVEKSAIQQDATLTDEEKVTKSDELDRLYAERSERVHSMMQLLKAYMLYEKDVEYVVKDGRVLIVDEFTGRLLPGRRFSEGLHQALEAKEKVKVEGETQTLATITLQNYFRLYEKLAGMTGTAETEAPEFFQIYKLEVTVIPTNEAVRRIDYEDVIFRTRREKYNAVIEEIAEMYKIGRPVLVGTVSVEASETLSRLLKRRGIPHNVLNAKFHQMEAEIVARAGQPGAVTIATNMAGRGTDIKLGPGIVKGRKCLIRSLSGVGDCQATEDVNACIDSMPCGLHIIGTERHEARRIDRQLRGRAGRQGDPGSSRFFLSLEDDLMRLFGSERIARIMDRLGVQEGEVIEHRMVTAAIGRAQKRVEMHNFDIRKHLLEYDNVMNQQREVIYGRRLKVLESEDVREDIRDLIREYVEERFDALYDPKSDEPDLHELCGKLAVAFFYPFPVSEIQNGTRSADEIKEHLVERALAAHDRKEQELTPALMRQVERHLYLRTIDECWKDHLYEIDQLKGGIGLRAYGQKDPLLEYKGEAYRMFVELIDRIRDELIAGEHRLFRVVVRPSAPPEPPRRREPAMTAVHAQAGAFGQPEAAASGFAGGAAPPPPPRTPAPEGPPRPRTIVREGPKVGRNDPCPCGSGKKYKKCHGIGAA